MPIGRDIPNLVVALPRRAAYRGFSKRSVHGSAARIDFIGGFALENDESNRVVAYPAPSMGADEERLFMEVAPSVRVQTLTE